MDGRRQDHAEDDGRHGRREVVADGARADLARQAEVQRADGGDDGRHDERQDQRLEHLQEDVSHERDVHYLPGRPFLGARMPEDDAEGDAREDADDGEDGEQVAAQEGEHFAAEGSGRHRELAGRPGPRLLVGR